MKKIILSLVFAFSFATSFSQTADGIINKCVDAIGGREKLKALKNMYLEGTEDENGQQTTVKYYWILKTAYRLEYTTMGMTDYTIVTKDSGWEYDASEEMKRAEPITAQEVKMEQPDLNSVEPILDYKEMGYKAVYKGKDEVDGSEAYKIELIISDSNIKTYFIDPNTYYIMRIKTKQIVDGQTIEGIMDYGNYQKTPEGYYLPMTISGGEEVMKFTIIKINTDIDPYLFKPKR